MNPEKTYITATEAAHLLNTTRNRIYKLIKFKKLSVDRIGRMIRIPQKSIDDYINRTVI